MDQYLSHKRAKLGPVFTHIYIYILGGGNIWGGCPRFNTVQSAKDGVSKMFLAIFVHKQPSTICGSSRPKTRKCGNNRGLHSSVSSGHHNHDNHQQCHQSVVIVYHHNIQSSRICFQHGSRTRFGWVIDRKFPTNNSNSWSNSHNNNGVDNSSFHSDIVDWGGKPHQYHPLYLLLSQDGHGPMHNSCPAFQQRAAKYLLYLWQRLLLRDNIRRDPIMTTSLVAIINCEDVKIISTQ